MMTTAKEALIAANLSVPETDRFGAGPQRAHLVEYAASENDPSPVVGVSYQCDFKAEEEWGVGDMRQAFQKAGVLLGFMDMPAKPQGFQPYQDRLVVRDERAMYFSVDSQEPRSIEQAGESLAHLEEVARGDWRRRLDLERTRMSDLRLRAPEGHKIPRKKDELIDLILQVEAEQKTDTGVYGGWFQTGKVLALPRRGALGVVLDHLWGAAQKGTLLVGGAGQVAFGSGLTLIDADDLSVEAQESILESNILYAERMEALEPVKAELRSRGHDWFFLGKPRMTQDGTVVYWLNGTSTRLNSGRTAQPCGWLTLDQLLAEEFLIDHKTD